MTTPSAIPADTEVFLRLWEREKLTPPLARHVLKLGFDQEEKARMHELAVKSQEGAISAAELRELDAYLRVGTLLSILQSRARKLLRRPARAGNGRG